MYLAPGLPAGDGGAGSRRSSRTASAWRAPPPADVVVGEVHADAHARERSSRVGVGQRRREGERVVVVESPPAKRAPTAVFDARRKRLAHQIRASVDPQAPLERRERGGSHRRVIRQRDLLERAPAAGGKRGGQRGDAAVGDVVGTKVDGLERRRRVPRGEGRRERLRGSVVEAATSEVEPPEPRRVFGERTRERDRSPPSVTGSSLPEGGCPSRRRRCRPCTPSRGLSAGKLSTAHCVHEEVRQRVSAAGAHLRAGQVQRHGGRVEREDRVARRSHRRGPVQGPPLEAEPLRAVRRDARADSLHSLRGCEGIPALTPPRGLRRPSSRLHALAPPKLVLVILPIRCEFVDGARHSVMR